MAIIRSRPFSPNLYGCSYEKRGSTANLFCSAADLFYEWDLATEIAACLKLQQEATLSDEPPVACHTAKGIQQWKSRLEGNGATPEEASKDNMVVLLSLDLITASLRDNFIDADSIAGFVLDAVYGLFMLAVTELAARYILRGEKKGWLLAAGIGQIVTGIAQTAVSSYTSKGYDLQYSASQSVIMCVCQQTSGANGMQLGYQSWNNC